MSCNCTNITQLPTITEDYAAINGVTVAQECAEPCLSSSVSEGSTLANSWTDAGCYNSGVTLLGRVGSTLARFTGTGFISLVNGVASVVSSVPLKATTLWHRWWKPTSTAAPILGEPLAYPYQVIADATGTLHGIKGPADEKAVGLWDNATKEFTQTPVSEIPLERKGVIPTDDGIELVGFTPIADGGSLSAVRSAKALSGAGIVVLTEQATVDASCECAQGSGTASVATTLALPVPIADETYTLKYSTAQGLYWSEDA